MRLIRGLPDALYFYPYQPFITFFHHKANTMLTRIIFTFLVVFAWLVPDDDGVGDVVRRDRDAVEYGDGQLRVEQRYDRVGDGRPT